MTTIIFDSCLICLCVFEPTGMNRINPIIWFSFCAFLFRATATATSKLEQNQKNTKKIIIQIAFNKTDRFMHIIPPFRFDIRSDRKRGKIWKFVLLKSFLYKNGNLFSVFLVTHIHRVGSECRNYCFDLFIDSIVIIEQNPIEKRADKKDLFIHIFVYQIAFNGLFGFYCCCCCCCLKRSRRFPFIEIVLLFCNHFWPWSYFWFKSDHTRTLELYHTHVSLYRRGDILTNPNNGKGNKRVWMEWKEWQHLILFYLWRFRFFMHIFCSCWCNSQTSFALSKWCGCYSMTSWKWWETKIMA